MKIYTSYFGNSKNLEKENIVVLGVSRYPPRWFNFVTMYELAPTPYMLSDKCSQEEYWDRMKKILYSLDREKIVAEIKKCSWGKDVALCCFETDETTCHRSLIAKWLNEGGYNVQEYPKPLLKTKKQNTQTKLF